MSDEKVIGYRFAGDIEVKNLILISQTGEMIDIAPIAVEVNVFQSLFEHYLQCEVVISDAVALINDLKGDLKKGIQGGFNGGEVIALSYKTRSKDLDFKTHFFGVYELSDRKRLDDKNESYVLQCVSAEAYQSEPKKISRAFGGTKGNLISNMVTSIVDEFIYNRAIKDIHRNYREVLGVRIEKKVDISPTNGLQRFLIPNLTPDETIDFLASEADSDTHIPFYLFYEDAEGFKFKDLNGLVSQEPKERYVYVSTNVRDDETDEDLAVRDFQKIISYDVISQTNVIENVRKGLFRQRTINLDLLRHKKTEVVYDYEKEFPKFTTLQKYRIPGIVDGDPVLNLVTSRSGHDQDTVLSPERHLPKRINQFGARQQSFKSHIFNTVVEVAVPGNSELMVGDVVNLEIPTATTLDKEDGKKDKYLSGKYLVTKVRHIFGSKTGDLFTTVFECTKDTGIEI